MSLLFTTALGSSWHALPGTSVIVRLWPGSHETGRGFVMDAARALVEALGGGDNIVGIEPCSLRIRVEVVSQLPVREDDLRIPCVLAVLRSGPVVQIIAGADSDEIAGKMKEIIGGDEP